MKNMKKRSPMMRVASVMLVLCLVLSCAVFGTMAKYISSTGNNDTATVAEWNFEINDLDFTEKNAQAMEFDLFTTTVNDSDNATPESDVETGKSLIAPGTSGQFDIKVENLSQVNAKYTIKLTETNANGVYIQYSLDGNTWYDDFAEMNKTLTASDAGIDLEMLNGVDEYTVFWRWVYDAAVDNTAHADQSDVNDTALGVAAQENPATVNVAIELVAWQVD